MNILFNYKLKYVYPLYLNVGVLWQINTLVVQFGLRFATLQAGEV
jgi:hypothetical protein